VKPEVLTGKRRILKYIDVDLKELFYSIFLYSKKNPI